MTYELKIYNFFCTPEKFVINGKQADYTDFGFKCDWDEASAEPYCCGNMHFEPARARQEILDKYGITVNEYNLIAEELEKGLSFGPCCYCS